MSTLGPSNRYASTTRNTSSCGSQPVKKPRNQEAYMERTGAPRPSRCSDSAGKYDLTSVRNDLTNAASVRLDSRR